MTKFGKWSLILGIIIVLIVVVFVLQKKPIVEAPVSVPEENMNLEILGNKDDLVSFSILTNTKVHGVMSYRGSVKGGYFFEANVLINILDANKKVLKASNAMATTDWMTAEPVEFEGNIDFTGLPNGPAYIEIHNDNASGLPENDKSILIPIVIEGQAQANPADIKANEKKFSGTITDRDDGCFADGLCFIEVDNKYWVLHTMGWTATKGTIEGELNVGAKVEVYAEEYKEESSYENTYTIIKGEKYYIKVVK